MAPKRKAATTKEQQATEKRLAKLLAFVDEEAKQRSGELCDHLNTTELREQKIVCTRCGKVVVSRNRMEYGGPRADG